MAAKRITPDDISRPGGQLVELDPAQFRPLPSPYDKLELEPKIRCLTREQMDRFECGLDGVSAVMLPRPESENDKRAMLEKFLAGLKRLFNGHDNWTFLQPLLLTMEYCSQCQTCSGACRIFEESGEIEIYRPGYRSGILRRLYKKYVKSGGKILSRLSGNDIDLTWNLLARLLELSYRCTICRRCAQACPIGVDNGLVTREIRKIFSQELGIAPKQLHELGTVQHLRKGSSTGMTPPGFLDNIEFMEDEIREKTGLDFKWPIDKAGADILLVHNAGEYLAWPENPEAFAIILEAAGINYTLSSELSGYDGVNYGVWYDDMQLARVAVRHAGIAKKLGVKKIVIGECGHSHKSLTVIADRILTGDLNVPRESSLTFLNEIVKSGRLRLDPLRNADMQVTLHDPCNMVRLMGIVKPQREIIKAVCPNFREMMPNGVENFCCGGGGGFAIMPNLNFPDWRISVAGRAKLRQVLDVFQDIISSEHKKFLCAPCSNCKGQIRDLFSAYGVFERCNILYGGLAELIVNAMTDIKNPFQQWEWR
ncbi:MAG: 4Fe-4S ferredoxin [candidate division Zixibacteria bacterium RBG_16_53_22]|nr:MAG: 4Fe-4S ferredoxin [candidate division Zixibacteria bacterium RBG_16_53_22]